MNMDESSLKVGLRINILRSNGRISNAVIRMIDPVKKCVTVMWSENGVTKNKKVRFPAVFGLNPQVSDNCSVQNSSHLSTATPDKGSLLPLAQNQKSLGIENNDIDAKLMPTIDDNDIDAKLMPPPASIPLSMSNKRTTISLRDVEEFFKREERLAYEANRRAEHRGLLNMNPSNPNWEYIKMIRKHRGCRECPLIHISNRLMNATGGVPPLRICVAVRKRPMNKEEQMRKEVDVVTISYDEHVSVPMSEDAPTKTFQLMKLSRVYRFDFAFDENADNETVYRYTAKPLVQTLFKGGMATCFAYGATGGGKTHTMIGDFSSESSQDCSKGIYALSAMDVFTLLNSSQYRNEGFCVMASFFEVYDDEVFDLLNNKSKLIFDMEQAQIVGLQERSVDNVEDVLKLIQQGSSIRTSGETSFNQHSSSSHAVFQIILKQRGKLHGKFSLIDLADISSANHQTIVYQINETQFALKECIQAVGEKDAHFPFDESKLTQVLQDSFIGENSCTCMIGMISPCENARGYSLRALDYVDNIKGLDIESIEKLKRAPSKKKRKH